MVAVDLHSPLNYAADHNINQDKHRYEDHDDEEEETLSLCDLPIYSDSFKWDDDFSTRDHSSNSFETDHDDDFFEFFSDDLTASTNPNAHKTDIVFCGKLIPYKGTAQQYDNNNSTVPQAKQINKVDKEKLNIAKKKGMFHFLKPSNDNKKQAIMSSPSRCEQGFRVGKVTRVSFLASASASASTAVVKPRWYFYLFGMMRLPAAEMELNDMRTRQRRRRSEAVTLACCGDEKGKTTKKKVSSKRRSVTRRSGVKGLWGLLRALRCRSRHVASVAKAAYGAVQRVGSA